MRLDEIIHPMWGSNLAKPIDAFGDDNNEMMNDCIKRHYCHRCGLFGIVQSVGRIESGTNSDKAVFILFLDGHMVSTIWPGQLEIRIDPSITALNGNNMVADIWFSGEGPLKGPLQNYFVSKVTVYLTEPQQLPMLR